MLAPRRGRYRLKAVTRIQTLNLAAAAAGGASVAVSAQLVVRRGLVPWIMSHER
jgi:hypothetical protein